MSDFPFFPTINVHSKIRHSRFAPECEFMCVASPLGRGNSFKQIVHWCIFDFFCAGRARSCPPSDGVTGECSASPAGSGLRAP